MSRLRELWPRRLIEPHGGMDWSPAAFSEDALQYLLAEARQRVKEQLLFMDSQDVRTRTAFSISVLLVAAVGIIGDVSINASPLALLTVVAFGSSVVTWVCSWVAYRAVDVGSGVNVATLARAFGGASRREMEDATAGVAGGRLRAQPSSDRTEGTLVAGRALCAGSAIVTTGGHRDRQRAGIRLEATPLDRARERTPLSITAADLIATY